MRSSSKNPFVQRILGKTGNFGSKIGLGKDWAYNAIKAVGNYGEIWEKHLGKNGLGMPRGKNQLHTNGGLLISPPFR
jgi:general L-amino acid transport system substrate-binding protein